MILFTIDFLTLGVNGLCPVVHVLFVGGLGVHTPRAQRASLNSLRLREMLHLETELVEWGVTGGAVEQILRGEGFADVAWLVLGLDDLHHLVGLTVASLHQAAVDEALQARGLIATWAAVVNTLAVAVIKAGVDIAIVDINRGEEFVPRLRLLQGECCYNVCPGLGFSVDLPGFLAVGNQTSPELAPFLQFARPAKFSFVETKFTLATVIHHTG